MVDVPSSAAEVIAALGLAAHAEGGFFRETFRAVEVVEAPQGRRARATSIAFLLTADRPSRFHRLLSAELWVHHGGAPLELRLLEPDGQARSVLLGPVGGDAHPATCPTARVPAHVWQAARIVPALTAGGAAARSYLDWSLSTCVVTPGFEYADFEIGRSDVLLAGWPQAAAVIGELT
ncbi:MAG: cupin domain-containing protein [Thermoleophilia bacterium]